MHIQKAQAVIPEEQGTTHYADCPNCGSDWTVCWDSQPIYEEGTLNQLGETGFFKCLTCKHAWELES